MLPTLPGKVTQHILSICYTHVCSHTGLLWHSLCMCVYSELNLGPLWVEILSHSSLLPTSQHISGHIVFSKWMHDENNKWINNKWVNEVPWLLLSLRNHGSNIPRFKQSFLIILYTVSHHENLLRNILNSSQVPDAGLRDNVGILLTKFLQVTTIPYYEMDKSSSCRTSPCLSCHSSPCTSGFGSKPLSSVPLLPSSRHLLGLLQLSGDTPATFPHLTD